MAKSHGIPGFPGSLPVAAGLFLFVALSIIAFNALAKRNQAVANLAAF